MGKGKHIGLGVAALAAGAGVAALAAGSHKNSSERAQKKAIEEKARAEYRNTERGRHEKNSKGIYYTNGNYEAFARPGSSLLPGERRSDGRFPHSHS